ncbi:hypothetical protein M409DRAFT_71690 [Zasmidium cellare ATCC 36951]|uniref:Uncharacterized protein n=1 Tax=Zasmidium cellare ATCC 36951 TaxID=1080233 RepID=A0A6A6BWJ2_ZASCE|nr:uncharacterized protein M409DRAFT_71690 [Zasmidium cellare ATCC 36951]KAF2158340.1 hypothetical protein M409DRAFT_71690 [Zasmidium cellare ATCC 36951]
MASPTSPEPIAVIGISCSFPGDASEPSRLWDALSEGKSAWSEVPEERFNMKAFHHSGNAHPGTTNTTGGHFLNQDIAAFDCSFFEIKPVEAQAVDPQQRLSLELAYEAFENAGLTLRQVWGSRTGVYVGQWSSDYSEILARDPEYQELYHTLGIGPAITSNRVSYFFNLRGPSFTVDTGCSASLVALHNAVQSLRSGESTMSVVTGVNLLLDPQRFTYQSKLKMFSPEGRSFSFDERANGYGRGEGCGCVVLKPLSSALKDGDRIRAVIRNSALNQDGRTPQGISVPSGEAQEEVIRAAYAEVGLDPTGTDYVEAHGTGTAVGDPIEAQAIANVLALPRKSSQGPLVIGSVKGNIGHTESAAGIAGLIKCILMLENQAIPPQVNYQSPNKAIPLESWNLKIPTTLEPRALERISLNSFGYGGTNAHVIVDLLHEQRHSSNGLTGTRKLDVDYATDRPRVFILSGAEEYSCHTNAERLAQYLAKLSAAVWDNADDFMDRLAVTINKRTVHDRSTSVVAYDLDDLLAQLDIVQQTPTAVRAPFKDCSVGYVFGGQGAQYHNMGREMIKDWPAFRQSLQRANAHLQTLGCTWNVLTELSHDKPHDSHVDEPEYGQLLSTAIQLALVDTLTALGQRPTSVVGHSSGEIAAAYAVDALSFEDALTVSYHRGRLTSQLISTGVSGAMLAVGTSADTAQAYVERIKSTGTSDVKIACYNSPGSVTLSGSNGGIESVAALLQDDNIFNRKLKTKGAAYHSAMMHSIEYEYRSAIASIKPRPLAGQMMSSLTGKKLPAGFLVDADYWARNLTSPVLFAGALRGMMQGSEPDGRHDSAHHVNFLLEVGPHAQMQGAVKETLQQLGSSIRAHYATCLNRKSSAAESMLRALADLCTMGAPVDLHHANGGFRSRPLQILNDVPPYAFNHKNKYWHGGRVSREFTHRQFLPHELLGNLSADVNHTEPKWRRFLRLKELPWLKNHMVQGQIVFPAAGYLAMALEAMRRQAAFKTDGQSKTVLGYSFSNCSFSRALVLSENDTDREICLSLRPETHSARASFQEWKEFRVFSIKSDASWTEHCRGRIRAVTDSTMLTDRLHDITEVKQHSVAALSHHITSTRFYSTARQVGMEWYAPFDNVVDLQGRSDSSVTKNKMPSLEASTHPFADSPYVVHPGMLDSTLFHGICASLLVEREGKTPVVPTFIRSLVISTAFEVSAGAELVTYALATEKGTSWDVQVESQNQPMMSVHGVNLAELPGSVKMETTRQLAHSPEWVSHFPSSTQAQIVETCNSALSVKSARKVNDALTAEVRAHVKRALDQVQTHQVAAGYQQLWYAWMQTLMATPFDPIESGAVEEQDVKMSESIALFEAVKIIGDKLQDLLVGTANPIALLTPNDLLGRLYSEPRNQRCYEQINAYCKTMGLHNPSLRVLEVGGGTASATLPLLQAMSHEGNPLVAQYDFTDISTAFFPAATKKLAEYSHIVDCKAFDLQELPETQDFELGSYDIVIACNVVHATPSIATSLEHLRQLLRPGGTLILMEITKLEPFYNLIFGSLSGWWAGASEGRVTSAILSENEWKQTLEKQGFQPDPVFVSDYAASEGGSISVILAKTPEEHKPDLSELSLHFASGKLDAEAEGGLENVAEQLRNRLGTAVRQVTIGGLEHIHDIARTVLILGPDTCEALSGRMDAALWQAFQRCALSCKAMLFITRGATGKTPVPNGALTLGFARSMRLEQPNTRYITLDLDPSVPYGANERLSHLLTQLLTSETMDFKRPTAKVDCEFAERDGQIHVNRLFNNPELERYVEQSMARAKPKPTMFLDRSRPLKVELGVQGLLETFRWVDDHESARALEPDEIRIEARAGSINFRDVLIATGELGASASMMNDCAGTVLEVGSDMRSRYVVGDRVCSYHAQAYNNYPIAHGDVCTRIPDNVSFALGASLPIVWATTYHSLVNVARLQTGESILVHAAAGAVGQAAVILAQHLGAVVYATCGSPEKRAHVESLGVPPSRIFTSRSTIFGPALRAATDQRGVDVVLNSLSGESFRESLECMASFGRFIEIGKKDFLDDALMPTKFLLRNITFACVDLTQMIAEDKNLVQTLLKNVVDLAATGKLKQVSLQTYNLGNIESAFRLLTAGKHIGKVVLTMDQEEKVPALPAATSIPKLQPEATYILVGGFGGLGLRLIRWLSARGARTIVTLSRSGDKSPIARACIKEFAAQGVKLLAKACDISSKEAVGAVVRHLHAVDRVGPVRGVINAAMALEDTVFEQMTYEQWTAALAPKVAGTWNLHDFLPSDMDFFVALSSIAGMSGHEAQANYTAACTFQDAFAHYRRSRGQAGYSINVGVVGDAGFVSETPAALTIMQRQGFTTITVAELLATLDYVLSSSGAESQASIGLIPEVGKNKAEWLIQRRLAHLVQNSASANASSDDSGGDADLLDQIKRAKTAQEALEAVKSAVLVELSKLTVTPVDNIQPHRTLDAYGVDSLVAVEFRNWIVAKLSADLSLLLIRESKSIEDLIRLIAGTSRLVASKVQQEVLKLS